jgi:hypothetical protein
MKTILTCLLLLISVSAQIIVQNPNGTIQTYGNGTILSRQSPDRIDQLTNVLGQLDSGDVVFDNGDKKYKVWNGTAFEIFYSSTNDIPGNVDRIVYSFTTVGSYQSYTNFLPSNATIYVQGYNAAGDGGGGAFFIDSSDTNSVTDGGMIFINTSGQRLKRNWSGGVVNPLWFGADPTGVADSTTAIQGAVNFASAPTYGPRETTNKSTAIVEFPAGTFAVSSILITNLAEFRGVSALQGNQNNGTVLYQIAGTTAPLIRISPEGSAYIWSKPHIHDMWLLGRKESNATNKVAISAVGSRISFTVATNSLPTYNAVSASYPYYGHCFFYTTEGYYLGSGWVEAINHVTGVVTLRTNTDWYATAGGSSLTTSDKVIFSPLITTNGWTGYSGVFAPAGNTGIQHEGLGWSRLSRMRISHFHTGINMISGFTIGSDLNIARCQFASVANYRPGGGSDSLWQSSYWQGYYSRDYGLSPAPTNLVNNLYRRTAFGFYMPGYADLFTAMTMDASVVGIIQSASWGVQYDTLLTDNVIVGGYWVDGTSAISGQAFGANGFRVRPLFLTAADEQPQLPTTGHTTFGLKSSVAMNANIGFMDVRKTWTYINNNTNHPAIPNLDNLTDLAALTEVQSDQLTAGTLTNVTSIRASGTPSVRFGASRSELTTITNASDNWFFPTSTSIGYAISGYEAFRLSLNGITTTNSITVSHPSSQGLLKVVNTFNNYAGSMGAVYGGVVFYNDITGSAVMRAVENGDSVTIWSGKDSATAGANTLALSPEGGIGTDTAGKPLRLVAGNGTGAGAAGQVEIWGPTPLASGTTAQTVSALGFFSTTGAVWSPSIYPALVASSAFTVTSTNQGFLPPRMTTAQRNAIVSPSNGLIIFCTDCTATDASTGVSQTYSSGSWRNHY